MNKIQILAFGAHPDDVELSAGGTLLRYKKQGLTTGIIDLTEGELGTRGDKYTRTTETQEASQILQLDVRENLKLADGFFEINEDSLLRIIQAIRAYQPDIVFANAPTDRHPDHGRASELVGRACFLAGLSKIEINGLAPWRPKNLFFYIQDNFIKPDFVVDITETHETKMNAIAAYKTQFYTPDADGPQTPISSKSFWELLSGRAQLMGRYAGYDYGEGFVQSRPTGIKDLMELD